MTEGPNTPLREDPKHEYADDRDMDRFWEVDQLDREPARQFWYVPLILVLIFAGVPWFGLRFFETEAAVGPSSSSEAFILGLPLWIWIPLGCTLCLSILTAFAVLWFWRDDDSESD